MINIIKSFDPPLNKHTVWIDLSTTPFSIKIHRNGDWEDANISENIIQYLSTGLKVLEKDLGRLQLKVEREDRNVPKSTSELTNDGEGGESGKFITSSDFEELFNIAFSEKFQSSTENLVSDANYTHTDNNFSAAYKNTLDNLATTITNGIRQYIIEHPEEFPEIDVDDELDVTSENPVLNKIITENLNSLSLNLEEHTTNEGIHMPSGGLPGLLLSIDADGNYMWTDLNYLDLVSYGIEWTAYDPNPDCIRVGNPVFHRTLPIQSKLRGCIAQKGKVMYYLNEDNWAYKEDGVTPSRLDGEDGTVRVDTGADFYIKSFINGNKRQIRISSILVDSTWHKVPRMLIDAYGPTLVKDPLSATETYLQSLPTSIIEEVTYHPLVSLVNYTTNCRGGAYIWSDHDEYLYTDPYRSYLNKPFGGGKLLEMRECARLAGAELVSYNYYKWVFVWLPIIEYATFNIQQDFNSTLTPEGYHQGGLGRGIGKLFNNLDEYKAYNKYNICYNGATNEFGNHSGCKHDVITKTDGTLVDIYIPRYRGLEDIYGDTGLVLDGLLAIYDDSEVDENGNCKYVNVYQCEDSQYFSSTLNEHYKLKARYLISTSSTMNPVVEFNLGDSADIFPEVVIPLTTSGWSYLYKCDALRTRFSRADLKDTSPRRVFINNTVLSIGINGLTSLGLTSLASDTNSDIGYRTLNLYEE